MLRKFVAILEICPRLGGTLDLLGLDLYLSKIGCCDLGCVSHSGTTLVLVISSQYMILVSETLDCLVFLDIFEMPIFIDNYEMLIFVDIYEMFV